MEFPVTNIAIALARAFVGPRRLVAGRGTGPDLRGTGFGLGALALGGVAALLTLAVRRHPDAGESEPVAGSKAA